MDYSQLKTKYVAKKESFKEMLEDLELKKRQTEAEIQQLENDYAGILASMGLKEGGKVEVNFPEDDMSEFSAIDKNIPVQGYIENIQVFPYGNVEIHVSLPGQRGQRLKQIKLRRLYTGVKAEWVTILSDDHVFGEN